MQELNSKIDEISERQIMDNQLNANLGNSSEYSVNADKELLVKIRV